MIMRHVLFATVLLSALQQPAAWAQEQLPALDASQSQAAAEPDPSAVSDPPARAAPEFNDMEASPPALRRLAYLSVLTSGTTVAATLAGMGVAMVGPLLVSMGVGTTVALASRTQLSLTNVLAGLWLLVGVMSLAAVVGGVPGYAAGRLLAPLAAHKAAPWVFPDDATYKAWARTFLLRDVFIHSALLTAAVVVGSVLGVCSGMGATLFMVRQGNAVNALSYGAAAGVITGVLASMGVGLAALAASQFFAPALAAASMEGRSDAAK